MRAVFTYFVVYVGCALSVTSRTDYVGYKAYSVRGPTDNLNQLKQSFVGPSEVIYLTGNHEIIEVLVAPNFDEAFQNKVTDKGLNATMQYEDVSRVIAGEKIHLKSKDFSFQSYYDVDDIYAYLRKLGETYSNISNVITGGTSYEGRPLLGLRILTQTSTNSTKPKVFVEAGIHAREWITPASTMYLINELLTSNDSDVISLRDSFEWHIFPTVNPDGYHYSHTTDRYWRKSRSRFAGDCYGVDLNRNFDYNWNGSRTSNDPCNEEVYCGPAPFSETETRTLSQYISSLDNLLTYITLHSKAQILLIPFSDSTEGYNNYDDVVAIGKASLDYNERVNGVKYYGPATAAQIIYAASGTSFDWVKKTLGVPLCYAYELRGSHFHWPPERIPEQGKDVVLFLIGLFKKAKELGYYA